MVEAQVGFLYNIAATLANDENSTHAMLRSYYLMRCKTITHGYGLPHKHFSLLARCRRCCLEWSKENDIIMNVRPIKLSKKQRQRIKSAKSTATTKKRLEWRKALLCSNELELICTFCKNKNITRLLKPEKQSLKRKLELTESNEPMAKKPKIATTNTALLPSITKSNTKTKPEVNLYTNALDIFALNNKNNRLPTTVKDVPKIIKNNKRKKDKFAGLCQKAVLASAKMKEESQKTKQDNKLDLFLKPSS